MNWLLFRALITLVLIAAGLWLALHEGRRKAERTVGIVVIVIAVLQSLDALFSLGDSVVSYFEKSTETAIHDVKVLEDRHAIEAYDRHGQPLWRRAFSGSVTEIIIDDLDSKEGVEVIVGIGGDDKDGGRVFAYQNSGKLLWSFDSTAADPYTGGSSGRMTVRDIALVDAGNGLGKGIVVLAHDVNWFPSRLALIAADGRLASDYWHAGHLHGVRIAQTQSGEARLIVYGLNNDLRQSPLGNGSDQNFSVIFALDAKDIAGRAPPYPRCPCTP